MSWYIEKTKGGVYVNHLTTDDSSCFAQFFPITEIDQAVAYCSRLNGGDGLTKLERVALSMQAALIVAAGADYVSPSLGVDLAKMLIKELDTSL